MPVTILCKILTRVLKHFTTWIITQHQESVKYFLTNWSTTHFVHIRNLLLKTSQLPFYGCMQIDVGKYPWFPLYKNPKMPNLRTIKHTHFASCKHVFVSTTSSYAICNLCLDIILEVLENVVRKFKLVSLKFDSV